MAKTSPDLIPGTAAGELAHGSLRLWDAIAISVSVIAPGMAMLLNVSGVSAVAGLHAAGLPAGWHRLPGAGIRGHRLHAPDGLSRLRLYLRQPPPGQGSRVHCRLAVLLWLHLLRADDASGCRARAPRSHVARLRSDSGLA